MNERKTIQILPEPLRKLVQASYNMLEALGSNAAALEAMMPAFQELREAVEPYPYDDQTDERLEAVGK